MREDIISFTVENRHLPFFIPMTGISYCDGSYKIVRKNSSICCVEYIISGTGTVETEGKIFHPSAGDIYILHEGEDHTYFSDSKNPWTKIWFNIGGNLVSELLNTYNIIYENHVKGLNLYPLFQDFLKIAGSKKLSQNEILKKDALILHQIIQEISEFLQKENSQISKEALILKNYLDNHIEKNITIDELAKLIYRSPSQTNRIFKNAFSTTPYDYSLAKKIETAKLLLKNTNMLIKEIAYKLGFSDEHYFSNYFRCKTGKSPKSYRDFI